MSSKILTARSVAAAKPKASRVEYPDAGCLGLYLVIQPSGTKSWALRCRRADGTSAKLTLGRAGDDGLTLAAARQAASTARLRLEQSEGTNVPPVPVQHVGDSIEATVAAFLEQHARRKTRPSTAWATERIFNRLVLPRWKGRKVTDIRRRDVIDLVEHIATDRPYQANRTLGTLSKFYNWCLARDLILVSPVTGVERPHKEEVRERTLTDDEVRRLWLAAEGPFGAALKLLILTGARRNEVSQMTWDEISGDTWCIPKQRSKNAREHAVTLSAQAIGIIKAQRRFADCPYVFTADGKRPITGWAKAKTRISERAGVPEASWRLHDCRRTCASGMQRLGIRTEAIERALNHRSGVYRGIVSRYQTDRLDDEVAVALERWASRVGEIVSGGRAKVVRLRRR